MHGLELKTRLREFTVTKDKAIPRGWWGHDKNLINLVPPASGQKVFMSPWSDCRRQSGSTAGEDLSRFPGCSVVGRPSSHTCTKRIRASPNLSIPRAEYLVWYRGREQPYWIDFGWKEKDAVRSPENEERMVIRKKIQALQIVFCLRTEGSASYPWIPKLFSRFVRCGSKVKKEAWPWGNEGYNVHGNHVFVINHVPYCVAISVSFETWLLVKKALLKPRALTFPHGMERTKEYDWRMPSSE